MTNQADLRHAVAVMCGALPYAGSRLVWLLSYSIGTIAWLCVMSGGSLWLSAQGARLAAWLWCVAWLLGHLYIWRKILRSPFHLLACGHVAVLTELITNGRIGNGQRSMLSYGRHLVIHRFHSATVSSGLQILVRDVIKSFHATLGWLDDVPPRHWPSRRAIPRLLLRPAVKYLALAILSYDLARNDADPWRATRDGVIYYCQNAKPMLRTAFWIVFLDATLTAAFWVLMLAPANFLVALLPQPFRDTGALGGCFVAALLAANLRAALLKPVLLIIVMVRFHSLAEGQVINPAWNDRLNQISAQFRTMWRITSRAS